MSFVTDRVKGIVEDKDRKIVVSRTYCYNGASASLPFLCRYDLIEFQFWLSETYTDRKIVDKVGGQHTVPRIVQAFIIENGLRLSINEAFNKAGLESVTDDHYALLKSYLSEAILALLRPEKGVEFIGSPADRGITDNYQSNLVSP